MTTKSKFSEGHGNRSWQSARTFLCDRSGGSAAEFAIVLFPMIFVFVLVMEFGLLLFVQNDMQNAARDSVRLLAVNEVSDGVEFRNNQATSCNGTVAPNGIEENACELLGIWRNSTSFTVTPSFVVGSGNECDRLIVRIATTMADATIFDIFGILGSRPLVATASMRSQFKVGGGSCD